MEPLVKKTNLKELVLLLVGLALIGFVVFIDPRELNTNSPPVARRLALSILLVLSGLFCAFRNPRFLGAAQVWFGFVLITCGGALWWITFAFQRTWGWWL